MLQTLYVKDFAIVGETEIAFAGGLTVVTGETGAGKSLLVDALLLLSGQRAEAGVVRHGCERVARRTGIRRWRSLPVAARDPQRRHVACLGQRSSGDAGPVADLDWTP